MYLLTHTYLAIMDNRQIMEIKYLKIIGYKSKNESSTDYFPFCRKCILYVVRLTNIWRVARTTYRTLPTYRRVFQGRERKNRRNQPQQKARLTREPDGKAKSAMN